MFITWCSSSIGYKDNYSEAFSKLIFFDKKMFLDFLKIYLLLIQCLNYGCFELLLYIKISKNS